MESRRVTLTFGGGAWASFGLSLLNLVLTVCVLPAAWGTAALTGWWCDKVRFSDASRLTFAGRPGEVWGLFAASVLLDLLPQIPSWRGPQDRAFAILMTATLVLLPLTALVKLQVTRWIVGSLRITPGGAPRLTASYGAFCGWLLIFYASFLTIVGWAWVLAAMARWLCGHVRGEGYTADFTGSGFGLLWRAVLWSLGFLVVLPIPWVLRSTYRWFTANLVLVREAQPA